MKYIFLDNKFVINMSKNINDLTNEQHHNGIDGKVNITESEQFQQIENVTNTSITEKKTKVKKEKVPKTPKQKKENISLEPTDVQTNEAPQSTAIENTINVASIETTNVVITNETPSKVKKEKVPKVPKTPKQKKENISLEPTDVKTNEAPQSTAIENTTIVTSIETTTAVTTNETLSKVKKEKVPKIPKTPKQKKENISLEPTVVQTNEAPQSTAIENTTSVTSIETTTEVTTNETLSKIKKEKVPKIPKTPKQKKENISLEPTVVQTNEAPQSTTIMNNINNTEPPIYQPTTNEENANIEKIEVVIPKAKKEKAPKEPKAKKEKAPKGKPSIISEVNNIMSPMKLPNTSENHLENSNINNDDEIELDVSTIIFDDKQYLIDNENNIYDYISNEKIGYYKDYTITFM